MPFSNIGSGSSSGGSGDTFDTIQPDAGTSPVASGASTLTLTSSDSSVTITGNSATDTIDFVVVAGSGDVTGPASSTDNAIVRFDGLTGKLIQNSTATLSDAGLLSTANATVTSLTDTGVVFSASGALTVDGTNFTWDNTNKSLITGDPGSEGVGINLNGTTYNSRLKVSDIGGTTPAQFIMHRHSTTLPAAIIASRSKSDTSSHTSVAAGDELFFLSASGWTGSHYDTFGIISFSADASGTVSSTSSPGRIDFRVAPDSSDSPAIALSIRQTKVIEMPGYTAGFAKFNGSGVISSSTISSTDLTDFNEAVDDRVAVLIQNGTGISWSYSDAGGTLTPTVSLAAFSTTNLSEGTNLYYTDERVDDRVAVLIQNGTGISWSYSDAGGTLTPTVSLASFSTTNLSEGTNLYYTDERVDDRVAALIQNGTGISWSYSDAGGTLTPTVSLASFSTTNLSEGSNLYFTDERAQDAVGTILTDSSTIDFTYNDGANTITAAVIANTSTQKVEITKNSGAVVGTRKQLNFIEGTNVTLTIADDGGNDQVDITIAASGGGGSMSIGGSITSGTATRVLFEGAGPVLADDADFTFDTATNTLSIPSINGGSSSGGDLTIESTSHGTKGDIILDSFIDMYPSLTTLSSTDVVHMMPTVTHTSGTTNWFRISPTETMSGAGVITRVMFVDGVWTQSGTSFGVFNLFYNNATFTTSDTNAPPAPLVFYNQNAYTIQHNVGSTAYNPTGFIDQQSVNCTTASANLTLSGGLYSFSSTPVMTSTNASATLTVANRFAYYVGDVSFTSTGSVTLTNNIGVYLADMVVGTSGNRTVTNVYGIYSLLTSNTNRFFINSDGDAQSYHKGNFRVGKASSAASELQFANASNSNITAFKAGVASAGVTYTLPTADGSSGQVLKTNGSGTLSWTTASGSSPLTTKGDIFTYTTVDARLAVGTNDYFLVADSAESTGLRWNGRVKAKTTSDSAGKTSDATITSADTVAELACTLVTGKKYAIRGLLMFSSTSATPDAKMQFRDDGSIVVNEIHAILSYTDTGVTTTASNQNAGVTGVNTDSTAIQVAATGRAIVSITGYVDVTTGGTLDIAWAQNTSNGTAVVLETGSWIMYEEI